MANRISSAFPYRSEYSEVQGQRMHFIEEGSGDPILFLHGNPTSSYLWRNIIPHVSHLGRCIAPDLIGMGKSDKPNLVYRFLDHYKYLEGFIEKMELRNLTLVVHDWGSGLGFHYASRHPDRIKRMAFMEAIIRPMEWSDFPMDFGLAFRMLRAPGIGWLMASVMNAFVYQVMPAATVRKLSAEELAHYAAPFPTVESRTPVRQWPLEIPIGGKPADVTKIVADYSKWLQQTPIPKLLFYARPGGLIRQKELEWIRQTFPNLKTVDIGSGIHYLQEDNPHLIGKELAKWVEGGEE